MVSKHLIIDQWNEISAKITSELMKITSKYSFMSTEVATLVVHIKYMCYFDFQRVFRLFELHSELNKKNFFGTFYNPDMELFRRNLTQWEQGNAHFGHSLSCLTTEVLNEIPFLTAHLVQLEKNSTDLERRSKLVFLDFVTTEVAFNLFIKFKFDSTSK